MEIVLYYAPIGCSLVPYVTLTEAGADFEVRLVNMRKGEHRTPDYLKLNPKHKVPVLLIDGEPLTENVAIQIWIARTFPKAKLLPAAPRPELKAISMLAWCASDIHPFLTRIHSPALVCGVEGSANSVRELAREQLFENFRIADDMLAGREFFFEHFTAVDAHFFWCLHCGTLLGVDHSGFANCTAFMARMKQRASFQKVLAFEKDGLAEFARAVA